MKKLPFKNYDHNLNGVKFKLWWNGGSFFAGFIIGVLCLALFYFKYHTPEMSVGMKYALRALLGLPLATYFFAKGFYYLIRKNEDQIESDFWRQNNFEVSFVREVFLFVLMLESLILLYVLIGD